MTTKLVILGEAWGEEEERFMTPFVGKSGWFLNQLLEAAGIAKSECHLTNVFNLRPKPTNDVSNLCQPTKNGLPALTQGQYIREEFWSEFTRLENELNRLQPNLVLALGSTALWALTGSGGISRKRGTVLMSNKIICKNLAPVKVLPAYHPSAILRDWSQREITIMDLMKAAREREYPEIRRPKRTIAIFPTIADLESLRPRFAQAREISIDIETEKDIITCIGFAPSKDFALVIPFLDRRHQDCNYWRTFEEELAAWEFVRWILSLDAEKIFQNGLYDLHFIWRKAGMIVKNAVRDTMLKHHAINIEMLKGLGFMGSLYTNEASWKTDMRGKSKTIKREA